MILKIPVLFGLWLVWWAVKDEPQLEDTARRAEDHGFRRWRREPRKPRGPRRGPHGGAARASPIARPPDASASVAPPRR